VALYLQRLVGHRSAHVSTLLFGGQQAAHPRPGPHYLDTGLLHGVLGVGFIAQHTESDADQFAVRYANQ
jgi:hypothetical protein